MQTSERLGGAGLVLAIAFSGGLALQSTYQADFASFLNSNAAEIVGLLVAVAMNLVFRTIDPAWNAVRISRSGHKAVSRLATAKKIELRAWAIEMSDRLGLVTSRINARGSIRLTRENIDGLRDLRVGLNIGTLRVAGEELGWTSRSALRIVLQVISSAYNTGLCDRGTRPVKQAIDNGIVSLGAETPSRAVLDTQAALVGLRLDLVPAGGQYAIPNPL